MRFELTDNSLDHISTDAAVVFAFAHKNGKKPAFSPLEDFKKFDEVVNGQLTKICNLEKFTAKKGEILSVIPDSKVLPSRVIIIGLGAKEEFTADTLRRAMGIFAGNMKKKIDSAALTIPSELQAETDLAILAEVIGEGLLLGSYEFSKYKKKESPEREFASVIIAVNKQQEKEIIYKSIKYAELAAQATQLARDLVNEPANVVTPTFLAKLAEEIAQENPKLIKCTIYDKSQAEKKGFGAFLAIAQAADTPPKFIHLEYKPAERQGKPENGKNKKKLALVGKGITFDSGGVSLKPPDSMTTMKCDMSGAATVLAIFSVIVEIKPDFPVMGIIAATPNLVSGNSIVPGDIAKAYNGKTIEILNTDAEGRVTLADSLSYAAREGATEIIDFATLTGAIMVALGNDYTGLFSNNRALAQAIKAAAYSSGEKIWELPLEKDYKKLNKSDVADIANIPNTRYGGAITAALFLEEFVENKAWAHLDIAGPAYLSKPSDIGPKGGTGYGVRTILNLLKEKE